MGRRKPKGRTLNGIVVLDKPSGLSSNQALQRAKWLFAAAKAGHTGSLDPLATGVLPLCFGEATKFSQFLLDADKCYRSTFVFGKRSETGDSEGELLHENGAAELTLEQIEAVLPRFRGEVEQVPSMYSALKHQGQPLYKLAREGKEVEREARKIKVYRLEVLDFRPGQFPELDVDIHCSKGTYVRSLAEDIGEVLGVGGLVTALHRTRAGPYSEEQAVSLDALVEERGEQRAEVLDGHLLPLVTAISHLTKVELPAPSAFYFRQGQPVLEAGVLKQLETAELVRVYDPDNCFLGVGEVLADGRIGPRRLVKAAPQAARKPGIKEYGASTANMRG